MLHGELYRPLVVHQAAFVALRKEIFRQVERSLLILTIFHVDYYGHSIKRLDSMAYSIIQERRKNEKERILSNNHPAESSDESIDAMDTSEYVKYDLVSLYLARQDEANPITDQQIRDIILNFLIAGRDTTAQVNDIDSLGPQMMTINRSSE